MANVIAERVLLKHKDLSRVRREFTRTQDGRSAVWTLSRTTNAVVCRAHEVEQVLASLRQHMHGAVVIWGGFGGDKTAIAMEAAATLRIKQPNMTAFSLIMRGGRAQLLRPVVCTGPGPDIVSVPLLYIC